VATFTNDELITISSQRRPAGLKPLYYDSVQKSLTTISDDFEGFLILQASESKQKALAWITDATKLDTKRADQNVILEEYIAIRNTDAAVRVSEISKVMTTFDNFKSDFLTDGSDTSRFADISEVNIFLQSVQQPLGDIATRRERAIHEQNMAKVQGSKLALSKVTSDTIRELESWQTIMSAYKGQASGAKQNGSTPLGGLTPT
jgi:hypothetical protein